MPSHKKVQVAFSMPGITFEQAGSQERAVHLLLTEYANYRYVLIVCTEDKRNDGTPQEILLRVKVPDDRVTFTFCETTRAVTVTRGGATSAIHFLHPADFWEVNRIISKAKRVDAVNELVIDALVKDAISNIPRGPGSSVDAGVQDVREMSEAETEGTVESEEFATAAEEAELVEAELADASGNDHVAESEAGVGAQ